MWTWFCIMRESCIMVETRAHGCLFSQVAGSLRLFVVFFTKIIRYLFLFGFD
jgi:hypothetical protein